jgi:nucleoside-diphosphate-sugar epimerase
VVNSLVGFAHTTGNVLIQSDGTPWRPLVHVVDISRAFLAVLEAPREAVHDEAFNVGSTAENYQIRDVAETVAGVLPGTRVAFAAGGSPDARSYRVDCSKLARILPGARPAWTIRQGAEELADAYRRHGMDEATFHSSRFLRVKRVLELQADGRLDAALRWRTAASNA